MKTIEQILKSSKLEKIISYLMDETNSTDTVINEFEKSIEKSYDNFFDKLEELYPEADRDNDELYEAATDLVIMHDEIFLTIGIAIGYNLNFEMERIGKKLKLPE